MVKIVYNACYGGFSLSAKAIALYCKRKGITDKDNFYDRDIERDDPVLVNIVKELGDKANGTYARLRIENVPVGTLYRIDDYDGNERVMTQTDYNWKIAKEG